MSTPRQRPGYAGHVLGYETTRSASAHELLQLVFGEGCTERLGGHEAVVLPHQEEDTVRERPAAAPWSAPARPVPGARIGQYELIRLLGRGGMGEVHLARDLRLGRLAAIKLLTTQRPNLGQRFLAEARATARCHHENIVVIHADPEKRSNFEWLLAAFSSLCPSCAHVRRLAAAPRRASANGSPCPPARDGHGRSASRSGMTCGA